MNMKKNKKIIFFHEKIKYGDNFIDLLYYQNNKNFIIEKTTQKNKIISTEKTMFDDPEKGYLEFKKMIDFETERMKSMIKKS
jgi:hypothetical protein